MTKIRRILEANLGAYITPEIIRKVDDILGKYGCRDVKWDENRGWTWRVGDNVTRKDNDIRLESYGTYTFCLAVDEAILGLEDMKKFTKDLNTITKIIKSIEKIDRRLVIHGSIYK